MVEIRDPRNLTKTLMTAGDMDVRRKVPLNFIIKDRPEDFRKTRRMNEVNVHGRSKIAGESFGEVPE